jgi:hypothetical protein
MSSGPQEGFKFKVERVWRERVMEQEPQKEGSRIEGTGSSWSS